MASAGETPATSLDKPRHLVMGESLQVETLIARFTHQLSQNVREWVLAVQRVIPIRANDQESGFPQLTYQELQEEKRGPVGPLQVV